MAKTLAAARTGTSVACALVLDDGAALFTRAGQSGVIRDGVDVVDVLDLAAAIAWIGEQPGRGAAQRARLLGIVLDGLGTT